MKMPRLSHVSARRLLIAAAASLAASSPLLAVDINVGSGSSLVVGSRSTTVSNFSGFSQNGDATINGGQTAATVTTNADAEAGSVWSAAPLTITDANGFSANFTYTAGGDMNADGATFSIQNDPAGSAALGGNGPGLGVQGLSSIVSYEINLFIDPGTAVNLNGLTGHVNGTAYQPTSPVQVNSGDPIAISLNYANGVLVESLRDTITGATYTNGYTLDLAPVLGGTSAYIGFTGGTGGLSASQVFSNFTFSSAAPTSQNVSGDHLTVSDGGSIVGIAGSLDAPIWNVTGGTIAAGNIAVSFTTFTQSGGNVSLGNIALDSGNSYSLSGGFSSLSNVEVFPGGSLSLSGGTLSTNTISNSGSFSWTAGTLHIRNPLATSIDNTNLGSVVAINPGMSLIVDQEAHIAAGTIFILNGGTFFPNSMTNDGMVFLNSGTFHMSQDLNIGSGGPLGSQLFVGNNLTVIEDGTLHVQPEGSLIASGGTISSMAGGNVTASFVFNEGTISVSESNLTASFASENDGIIDAIRSFVTFGGGDEEMTNFGTLNLIDTTVFGDLHNTSGALMRTAGGVTFNGNVTSDAPVELEGAVQFNGAANALAAINGSADVFIAPSAVLTTGSATAHSFNVSGSLVLQPGAVSAAISGTGSIVKQGGGKTTLSGAYTATGSIAVSGGGGGTLAFGNTSAPRQTAGVLLTASSVSVASSNTLDLGNHDLLIHSGSTGGLEAQVGAAYDFDLFDQAGISSSTAGVSGGLTTLGINSADDYNSFGTSPGVFDGSPVVSGDTLIKYTYAGDLNLDGVVDDNDLFQFLGTYLGTQVGDYAEGDLNYDGVVDDNDLFIFLANYLNPPTQTLGELDGSLADTTGVSPAFSLALGGSSPVPEPASLAVLGLGAAALMRRKKSRSC